MQENYRRGEQTDCCDVIRAFLGCIFQKHHHNQASADEENDFIILAIEKSIAVGQFRYILSVVHYNWDTARGTAMRGLILLATAGVCDRNKHPVYDSFLENPIEYMRDFIEVPRDVRRHPEKLEEYNKRCEEHAAQELKKGLEDVKNMDEATLSKYVHVARLLDSIPLLSREETEQSPFAR